MQSIKILLSFLFTLLVVLFFSVMDHASVIQVASDYEHHHMSDVESVDEEPTHQHPLKFELHHLVWLPILKSSRSIDSNFYPSPFFDIIAPPPEC